MRIFTYRGVLGPIFLFFISCNIKPLPVPYLVQDLRVVSMIADPPEAQPGQTVKISAYFADPEQQADKISVFFAECKDEGENSGYYDCLYKNSYHEIAAERVEQMSADGLFWKASVSYVIPLDSLQGKSPLAAAYGFYKTFLVRVRNEKRKIDAFKRIVVSAQLPIKANRNPIFTGLLVYEGEQLKDLKTPDAALVCGEKYFFKPVYDPDSIQLYQLLDYQQKPVDLTEQAIFSWSCSMDCEIAKPVSSDDTQVGIIVPKECDTSKPFSVYSVMRDTRGGESYQMIQVPIKKKS